MSPESAELAFSISGDILDQGEFWMDTPEEFLELFQEAVKTDSGRAFVLFLLGQKDLDEYLRTM